MAVFEMIFSEWSIPYCNKYTKYIININFSLLQREVCNATTCGMYTTSSFAKPQSPLCLGSLKFLASSEKSIMQHESETNLYQA